MGESLRMCFGGARMPRQRTHHRRVIYVLPEDCPRRLELFRRGPGPVMGGDRPPPRDLPMHHEAVVKRGCAPAPGTWRRSLTWPTMWDSADSSPAESTCKRGLRNARGFHIARAWLVDRSTVFLIAIDPSDPPYLGRSRRDGMHRTQRPAAARLRILCEPLISAARPAVVAL